MTTMGDQQRNNSSDEGGKKGEKKKAKPTTNQKRKELKKEIAEKQETNKREQAECDEKEEENKKLRAKIEECLRLIGDEQRKGCVIDESCMAQWKEAREQYAKICQNSPSSSQGNRAVKLTACSSDVVPHSNGDTSAPIGLFHGQEVTRSNVKRTSCAATSTTVTSADQTTTQASGLQNGDGIPTSLHSMPTATTSIDTVLMTRQTCPLRVSQLGTDPLQNSVPHLSQYNGVNGIVSVQDNQPQGPQPYVTPGSLVQPRIVNGHNGGFVNSMPSPNHHDGYNNVNQNQQIQNHNIPVPLTQAVSPNPSFIRNGHNSLVVNDVNFASYSDSCSDVIQFQQTQNSLTPASLLQAGTNSSFITDTNNVLLKVGSGGGLQLSQNVICAVELQQPQANCEESGQSCTTGMQNRPPATITTQVQSYRGGNATMNHNAGQSNTGVNTVTNHNAGLSCSGINTVPNNNAGLSCSGINTVPNNNAGLSFNRINTVPNHNTGLSCSGINTVPNSNAGLSYPWVNIVLDNNAVLCGRQESLTSSQTDSISSSQNSQVSTSTITTDLDEDPSFPDLFDLFDD